MAFRIVLRLKLDKNGYTDTGLTVDEVLFRTDGILECKESGKTYWFKEWIFVKEV